MAAAQDFTDNFGMHRVGRTSQVSTRQSPDVVQPLLSNRGVMSDIQIIESALKRAAARRRLQRALNGFAVGLLAGGAVLFLAIASYKLFPIERVVVPVAAIAAAVLAVIGFVLGGWRQGSLIETAQWVDERRQLKERLSTALEMTQTPGTSDWKRLLLTDAAKHAQSLDPRQLLVFRLPRVAKWALLIASVPTVYVFFNAQRRAGCSRATCRKWDKQERPSASCRPGDSNRSKSSKVPVRAPTGCVARAGCLPRLWRRRVG
jgi:hypothetical protein